MAKITELDHGTKTEISQHLITSGTHGWIETVMRYIQWFLELSWMVLVVLFTTRKNTESSVKTKKIRQIGLISHEGNIADNDDDYDRHGNHHPDANHRSDLTGLMKRIFNRSYSQTTAHIDENMFPWMATTATSFDHVLRISLFQSSCQATYKPSKNYERVMNQLVWLEDNGDFETFDQLSSTILSRCANNDPETTTAVLIEQSRCMLFRNRVPQAKSLAQKALELSSSTTSPGMFIARACLVISGCYRRKGKLGKAKLYLEQAEQTLSNSRYYEDWCQYYDAYGSYLNSVIDTLSTPSPELYKIAHESFHKQLQTASQDSRTRVREKNQFYALLKMARTLLDANTSFGRQREITASDIHKASECLDKIENELWESVPRGTHIQFLVIRCKQYYREMRFQEGFKLLRKCLQMAKAKGYERDLALIVAGVEQIKSLMHIEEKRIAITAEDLKQGGERDKMNSSSGKESELCDSTDAIDVFESELGDSS